MRWRRIVGRAFAVLALGLCLVAGCPDSKPKADPERAALVTRCVRGLESAMSTNRGAPIDALVASCPEVCPGLGADTSLPSADAADATRVVRLCGGFCTPAAEEAWRAAAPEDGYAALAEACGADRFGLDETRSTLLSDSWLFLLRTYEWLQNNQRHVDQATRDTLARAGDYTHFTMPLPARVAGSYALAPVQVEPADRARRPLREHFYAVVAKDEAGGVRVAARPIVRLRSALLEERPVPGGYFPGQVLAPGSQAYDDLFRTFADLHPVGMRDGLERRPLVLIDGAARVSRLVAAMRSIGVEEFALGVSGPTAGAHVISVRLLAGPSAAPVLRMGPDEIVLVGADETVIPRTERHRLEARLADLSVEFAPLNTVEIALTEDADVTALVAALDLVATSKFATALLR